MSSLWMASAAANVVLVVVYGTIALTMIQGLTRGRQWRSNPLAVATAAIFVACTLGHGAHILEVLLPAFGVSSAATQAARDSFSDPRLLFWDAFTAGVAIWYFTLRSRLQLFFEGAALCADLQERQNQAQALHDDVVQGLAKAKLALELGHREEGRQAIADTLASAKGIITGLLGGKDGPQPIKPGDLRRKGRMA